MAHFDWFKCWRVYMMLKDDEYTEFWKRKIKSQKLNSKKMGSCEVLAGCFWLSKLEEMNGG